MVGVYKRDMRKFHVHVIPQVPAQGDRGVVYNVEAANVRQAISEGRKAHRAEPNYERVRHPHRDWFDGGHGPLVFTAVAA